MLKGHANFHLKLKEEQIDLKQGGREKEPKKNVKKEANEDWDADKAKRKKKRRKEEKEAESKVMKQQHRMHGCSEWMIGGPRCL